MGFEALIPLAKDIDEARKAGWKVINEHIGTLDKALDEANAKGWTVVDMKKDWSEIYPK